MKTPGRGMSERDMWTVGHRESPSNPAVQQGFIRNPAGQEVHTAALGEEFAVVRGAMRDQFKVIVSRGKDVVKVLHDTMPLDEAVLKVIHNSCIPKISDPGRAMLWGRDVALNGEQISEVAKLLAAVDLDLARYKQQVPLWQDFQKALDSRRAIHGEFAESSDIVVNSAATAISIRDSEHGRQIVVPPAVYSIYLWTIKYQELTESLRRYQIQNGRAAGDLYGTTAQDFGVKVRQLYTFHLEANKQR